MRRRGTGAGALAFGLVAASAIAAATGACLDELPSPLTCPPAAAFDYCAPSDAGAGVTPYEDATPSLFDAFVPTSDADDGNDGAIPPPSPISNTGNAGSPVIFVSDAAPPVPSPLACELAANTCLVAARGGCGCTSDNDCSRAAPSCFPAGDCPPALLAQVPRAACIPLDVAGYAFAPEDTCTCGCASCSATTDGRGPVLGGDAELDVALGSVVPAGTVGVFVHWRGVGSIAASLRDAAGTELAVLSTAVDTGNVFRDAVLVPTVGSGDAGYTSSAASAPPASLALATSPGALLEIDALTVFVTP